FQKQSVSFLAFSVSCSARYHRQQITPLSSKFFQIVSTGSRNLSVNLSLGKMGVKFLKIPVTQTDCSIQISGC
ncbi:unnamed protein product, partial [Prunus brigantina]